MNPDNGLGQFVAIGNLTAVAVMLLLIVWVVVKAVPAYLDRQDRNEERRDKAHVESRNAFFAELSRQTEARTESAKAGHDAAMRIADSLTNLANEVRGWHHDQISSADWRNSLESGGR
ncbi:hypothetical protein EKK58_12320 [Candidatus Dependentiae bacterium]|nr:MAG: hypothetical protein EKK58_12320 [Candidatus Dependentiae bacterium]